MQHPGLYLLGTHKPRFAGLLTVVMKHSFQTEHRGQMGAAGIGDTPAPPTGKARKGCLLWEGTVLGPRTVLRHRFYFRNVPCVRPPDYAA